MKKTLIIASVFLLFCGCFARHSMMTRDSYDEVQVGTPISEVVKKSGEPYAVHHKNGMDEYEYIERVTTGNQLIYENHYTLYVKDGSVVGKSVTQEKVPAFDLIYQDDPNHNTYP
jgi:hypothetical protein